MDSNNNNLLEDVADILNISRIYISFKYKTNSRYSEFNRYSNEFYSKPYIYIGGRIIEIQPIPLYLYSFIILTSS
jgi:hypothetical protein